MSSIVSCDATKLAEDSIFLDFELYLTNTAYKLKQEHGFDGNRVWVKFRTERPSGVVTQVAGKKRFTYKIKNVDESIRYVDLYFNDDSLRVTL